MMKFLPKLLPVIAELGGVVGGHVYRGKCSEKNLSTGLMSRRENGRSPEQENAIRYEW